MLPRWGKHIEVSKPVQVAQAVGKLQDLNLLPTDSKSVALSIELSLYALAVGYGRELQDELAVAWGGLIGQVVWVIACKSAVNSSNCSFIRLPPRSPRANCRGRAGY